MHRSTVIVAIIAAALLWAVVSAQQEMLPRPGPGSGITNVSGSVSIANTPNVRAAQDGEWRVAVGNTPSVRVAEVPSASFLRGGSRYEITWADGNKETITVLSTAANGWIEVERGQRWVNLSSARAVSQAK